MSPRDDTFLSASKDNTVRVWDSRSSTCQGLLKTLRPSFIAFDPTAVLFAVGSQAAQDISLYDVRNFDKQPFSSFKLPDDDDMEKRPWDKVEFSNTGKTILVATFSDTHYLLDSFTGALVARLVGHKATGSREKRATGRTTFSGDGRFVIGGSGDGSISMWDTKAEPLGPNLKLYPMHVMATQVGTSLVTFNSKTMMFATGDTSLVSFIYGNAAYT